LPHFFGDNKMARQLDRILVVDIESTCWEDKPPRGQESEIIEIGLCVLDVATLERLEKRSIMVKPARSAVSPFCTALTTLTQAEVNQGIALADACAILAQEYDSRQRTWASYGDYDRRQFERQCAAKNISYPFGPTHINVKNLFAVSLALAREVGMDEALRLLNLPLEGTHHRGGDDAWNIAKILGTLLQKCRLST
jgi:inhibitor of KinA sporulation pathway (predicted exonuclease)